MKTAGPLRCLSVATLVFAGSTACAEEGILLHLGRANPALHLPIGTKNVIAVPAFEDYAYMMFDVCDAMGLTTDECTIFPMNGALGGNAIATVADGNRIIVYDRGLSPLIGGDGAEMVIAHEVAHHYCGHLNAKADLNQELQADRFAGAAMKLMGRPLAAALSAVSIMSERPSASHPARADREKAIKEGWESPAAGKHCR